MLGPSPRPAPAVRVRVARDLPVRPDGDFVLYWMTAARRPRWNFALQHALAHAARLGRPLLVLEALRAASPYASDRFHAFVAGGMRDNHAAFQAAGVGHHAYLEPGDGAGRGLLAALAARACVVVADDSPASFLPRMLAAAAATLPARLEAVDGVGLLPLRAGGRAFPTAHSFRRHLQKELPAHLAEAPLADPLAGPSLPPCPPLPEEVLRRWPATDLARTARGTAWLADFPIDHAVPPVAEEGGTCAASAALGRFLDHRLARYDEDRNAPDLDATSHLSGWLHFGHLSAHELVAGVLDREDWSPDRLGERTDGSRSGWWGASPSAEAFLDQVVTWRELGHQFCAAEPRWDRYDSLPEWARRTLAEHALDPRPSLYRLEDFDAARTHDPLWNAAQNQLRREGRIHNYLRMLWGKKVLHWSASPEEAFHILFALNDRYAIDGRDPNSVSGLTWCLGRFDRAWGPERPVFGKIRYMTSENTARKWPVREYLARYGSGGNSLFSS
jgi:deoxyribodipyrimidine photo-lyase